MIYYLSQGVALGAYAGLSPGPLMTLVIAESLRGGWPAGFRVALAPLISDGILITVTMLLTAPLPAWGISLLSVVGGVFMVWIGLGTIRSRSEVAAVRDLPAGETSNLLLKGAATNVFNPQAILFWLVTGAPLLREAIASAGWAGPVSFMLPFFTLLIGLTFALAYGVSQGRNFMQGRVYRWSIAAAGSLLCLFGVWRIWAGIRGLI